MALLLVLVLVRRVGRLRARVAALTGGEGGDLEAVLGTHLERVARLDREVDELAARTSVLEAAGRKAFQRVGLVRFSPFEDTGGNQSFALVLLDADEDGVVVSSLHARAVTRIYAKAISRGRPEAGLSDEEAEALALARSSSLGRAGLADRTGDRGGRDRGERVTDRGRERLAERPTP